MFFTASVIDRPTVSELSDKKPLNVLIELGCGPYRATEVGLPKRIKILFSFIERGGVIVNAYVEIKHIAIGMGESHRCE